MLDYIRSILSLIFAVSLMYVFLDCEIKGKKNAYFLSLYVALLVIFNSFVLLNWGYVFFMKWYPLFVHLPVFLGFVFLSKFNAAQVFFIHWTLVAVTTSLSMIGLTVAFFLNYTTDFVNIVCYFLYLPTWILAYRYVRPQFLYMFRTTKKGWLSFSMIPISYALLLYSVGQYNMDKVISRFSVSSGILLFILAFFAYFLILRFFKQSKEQHILQEQQNILHSEVVAAKLHFKALEESQEKTLVCHHDMRHHLSLINSFLAEENIKAAQEYIKEVGTSVDKATLEKYCENYVVNLILYSYITDAKKEDIKVETQINLSDDNTVSDMDLCVIFSNIVENATNACKMISSPQDRFIKIVCRSKNDKLFIQITNSYEGDVEFKDNLPVTMMTNHGLGTKSIVAVSQKYGGVYSFTAENGIFTTSIIL